MKNAMRIVSIFLSIVVISACAPNSEERENGDGASIKSSSSELSAEKDSLVKSEADSLTNKKNHMPMDNDLRSEEAKKESSKQSQSTQGKISPKTTPSVPINRKVGLRLEAETDFDLMGFAAEEVVILNKEDCEGDNCGNKIQLQSYNAEKIIIVVVQIKWKESSGKMSEFREYQLEPESIVDIGCSRSCDDNDAKYFWKIVSAKYN